MPHADPETRRAYQRAYKAQHRERLNRLSRDRKRERRLEMGLEPGGKTRKLPEDERRRRQRAATRRWKQNNPEKVRGYVRARRARLIHRKTKRREYATLLLGDPCCFCGSETEEIDHIVPVGSGGDDVDGNLTAACRSCNRHKSDIPLLSFLLRRNG